MAEGDRAALAFWACGGDIIVQHFQTLQCWWNKLLPTVKACLAVQSILAHQIRWFWPRFLRLSCDDDARAVNGHFPSRSGIVEKGLRLDYHFRLGLCHHVSFGEPLFLSVHLSCNECAFRWTPAQEKIIGQGQRKTHIQSVANTLGCSNTKPQLRVCAQLKFGNQLFMCGFDVNRATFNRPFGAGFYTSIWMMVLPWFWPSSIPINVAGADSMPCVMSSLYLILPASIIGSRSCKKWPKWSQWSEMIKPFTENRFTKMFRHICGAVSPEEFASAPKRPALYQLIIPHTGIRPWTFINGKTA